MLHFAWSSGTEYALVQSCCIIVQETITQAALTSGNAQFCMQPKQVCKFSKDGENNE